ncbi:MAG: hypothetical protein U5N56_02610 [Candidatus Marinimicrobia bacterium]|nr:hypothetical protein [Candidatus Neomarinimicrobiota bacterium]
MYKILTASGLEKQVKKAEKKSEKRLTFTNKGFIIHGFLKILRAEKGEEKLIISLTLISV